MPLFLMTFKLSRHLSYYTDFFGQIRSWGDDRLKLQKGVYLVYGKYRTPRSIFRELEGLMRMGDELFITLITNYSYIDLDEDKRFWVEDKLRQCEYE